MRKHNFDKTDLNRIAKIGYGYIRGMKVDSIQLWPLLEVDIQICQPERGCFTEGLPEGKQPVKGW